MAVLGNRNQMLIKIRRHFCWQYLPLTLSLVPYSNALRLPFLRDGCFIALHWQALNPTAVTSQWSSSTSLKLHTPPCRLHKSVWRSLWSTELVQASSFQKRCYIAGCYLLQTLISPHSLGWGLKGATVATAVTSFCNIKWLLLKKKPTPYIYSSCQNLSFSLGKFLVNNLNTFFPLDRGKQKQKQHMK